MADEAPKTPRPKASREAAEAHSRDTAENPVETRRYEREYLVEMGRALLNTDGPIVAGALASRPDRVTFTLVEAEDLVAKFLKRPVEVAE